MIIIEQLLWWNEELFRYKITMTVRLGKKSSWDGRLYNLSSRRDNVEKLTMMGGRLNSCGNIRSKFKTPHVYTICQTVTIINHRKNKRKSIWTDELNFYRSTNHCCCTLGVIYNFLKRHSCLLVVLL